MNRLFYIIAICAFIPLCATAQKGTTKDGFKYRVKDNAVTITKWKGKGKHVVIPGTINGLPVAEIASYAFDRKKLQGVVLPESLAIINSGAFSGNNIDHIVVPKNIKHINFGSIGTIEIPYELDADAILNFYPSFFGWY